MYRTYNKDCDIRIFLTIYPNESLKIKTDLDAISIFLKYGRRNPKIDNFFFFLIARIWTG